MQRFNRERRDYNHQRIKIVEKQNKISSFSFGLVGKRNFRLIFILILFFLRINIPKWNYLNFFGVFRESEIDRRPIVVFIYTNGRWNHDEMKRKAQREYIFSGEIKMANSRPTSD
jgi:hypothetical protein